MQEMCEDITPKNKPKSPTTPITTPHRHPPYGKDKRKREEKIQRT